jgi:hypothetical protein
MHLTKRATAEFLGTFWLVFGRCGSVLRCGGGADILFSDDHHGSDGQASTSRVCTYCDWTGTNLDSSHWNPGYKSLGKPRSEYRPRPSLWEVGQQHNFGCSGSRGFSAAPWEERCTQQCSSQLRQWQNLLLLIEPERQ